MMSTFARATYEHQLYTLSDQYPAIAVTSLRLYTNSITIALVRGSVHFHSGLELRVFEYLDLSDGELLDYSYTVWYQGTRLRWYDAQPHPENPALAETFPHHCHEPPDIKHNRCPAPGITFQVPNLPALIADCIDIEKHLPHL